MTPRPVVALVDDHALFVHSMRLVLEGQGYAACAVDPDGDVGAEIARLAPDVVLLDLALGSGRWGPSLLPTLGAGADRVLALTGESAPHLLGDALLAGCVGVLQKAGPVEDLLEGLRVVLAGEVVPRRFADPQWTVAALRWRREQAEARAELADFARLTGKERAVLAAMMTGADVTTIARDAVVSTATVRTQVRAVLIKLGVTSQTQAVARAARAGWHPTVAG